MKLAYEQQIYIETQQKQIEIQKPKVEAFEAFLSTKNSFTFNEAAKALGTGQNRLFVKLRAMGILIEDGPNHNLPKQPYLDRNYFTTRHVTVRRSRGDETVPQTLVTAKGLEWLRRQLTPIHIDHAA